MMKDEEQVIVYNLIDTNQLLNVLYRNILHNFIFLIVVYYFQFLFIVRKGLLFTRRKTIR